MTISQDSTKDMTVSSQKKMREERDTTNSTTKNIKDIAIKSKKRLIGGLMFVQQIRATLHKDWIKPRKRKLRFEISDKAAAFKSNILRRKTFDTEVFRGKDTVISPGYESLDIKELNKLLGNHDNYFKLESIIDEGLRYPIHNYYGYT